ncbi:MAG: HAD-IIIC family phosphatase [Lachnospiraceae bacterium]|nr:HAD-IIIC family phosphatase [Lachnospiraceae bacterium]
MTAVELEKIKLIIWDLDDTFWTGILSEEEVEIPQEHIELIRHLTDCGVINSISSKNDPEPVKEMLEKAGIWDLFVFNHINWEEKGRQIAEKLQAMALRAENVLFIDDSVRNREEALSTNPGLMTADPGIIGELRTLYDAVAVSDASHKRLKHYKILETKNVVRAGFSSEQQFLYDSQIKIAIDRNCLEQIDRITELVARTNQLNYTKHRDDREYLIRLITNDWNDCGCIRARDRFGDYGIIGFFCYNTREKSMEHFLFSCRVLGMGIEQYVYNLLGCPAFTVEQPVASDLKQDQQIDWIEEVKDEEILRDKEKSRRVRLLLKGPCDMDAIYPYLAGANITTEFNFVNAKGFVTTGQNHSEHIRESMTLSDKEIEEIGKSAPFILPEDFETKILKDSYHVICYSLQQDFTAGMYENKKNGCRISFGGFRWDLTDEKNRKRYIDGEIQNHGFTFTDEIIDRFADEWDFIGGNSVDRVIDNLDLIYKNVPGKPLIILLLGSTVPYEGYDEGTEGLLEMYRNANPVIREFAERHDRVKVIDPSAYIHSNNDYRDNINHFSRNVYYEIAGEICNLINMYL